MDQSMTGPPTNWPPGSSQAVWQYTTLEEDGWAWTDESRDVTWLLPRSFSTWNEGTQLPIDNVLVQILNQPNQLMAPNGPYRAVQWKHQNPYTETAADGSKHDYQPTGAVYKNIYNTVDGLIIAWDIFGPAYQIKRLAERHQRPIDSFHIPELSRWSDVTFLEWEDLHDMHTPRAPWYGTLHGAFDVSYLKYMMSVNIVNDETRAIIAHALAIYGIDIIPGWPGVIFTRGEPEFLAILASPNGVGMTWFLSQHKQELGHKLLGQVTVYDEFSGTMVSFMPQAPNLVWTVIEVADV